MEIAVEQRESATVVSLTGRLDILTFQEVGNRLNELIAGGATHLVLDAAGLSYVSSAGLRVILQARKSLKASNGTLAIAAANDFVMDVMNTTGFTSIIPSFATLDEALRATKA